MGVENIVGDQKTKQAIVAAAQETGVSADQLYAMAIMESGGDRNIDENRPNPPYTGLMQMSPDAAGEVGFTNFSSLTGQDNVDQNVLAGAEYMKLNATRIGNLEPNALNLYLAHQQGATGLLNLHEVLQTNPDSAVTPNQSNNLGGEEGDQYKAILEQTGKNTVSQKDFYEYYQGRMGAIDDAVAQSELGIGNTLLEIVQKIGF